MKTTNSSYDRTGAEGQTLVEFALILFLLLTVLFGITEFGRAWYYSNALTNGVREGARLAATLDTDASYVDNVSNYTFAQITSVIPGDKLTGVTVNPPDFANISTGTPVTVTATYDFEVLTGSIVPHFSGTKQITRQATMRYE